MRVSIDTVPSDGETFAGPVHATALQDRLGAGGEFRPLRDGHMQLRLAASDGVMTVQGRVAMPFSATCSRCAGPMQQEIAATVGHRLVSAAAAEAAQVADDDDLEGLGPDDEDVVVSRLTGREVDLAALACEDLLVALPMRALCSAECRGLCPQCGTNRNLEACACRPVAELDARLAPLAKLKL